MTAFSMATLATPWFWFQPVFYSVHGWIATEMALWMLFHPYEPIFIPGTKLQLPFTPGIFPRGRRKLSVSIANTITDILLTKDDIKKQARKLITEENILAALDALLDSIVNELRDIQHLRQLYRSVEGFLPPVVQKLARDFISQLKAGDDKLYEKVMTDFLDRLLPHLHLSAAQAAVISDLIFTHWFTPEAIRKGLIETLTSDNIGLLEEGIRTQVSGVQGFLIRFIDLQKGFTQFRQFLLDEPTQANALMQQLVAQLGLQDRLQNGLVNLSTTQLSADNAATLKASLTDILKNLLVTHEDDIVKLVGDFSREATQSVTTNLLQTDFKSISEDWLPNFKKDLAHFVYTYLNKELESMVSKALPVISLNTVIIDKIDQFSAKELEETIQRICRNELKALAYLGGFLGFWLGLVSNFINLALPHP